MYIVTTRKLINTNGNTEGIFSSVNFRGILPTELPWEKNLKQSKKKKINCEHCELWTLFIMSITKGITDGIFRRYFSESVIWQFSEIIQLI